MMVGKLKVITLGKLQYRLYRLNHAGFVCKVFPRNIKSSSMPRGSPYYIQTYRHIDGFVPRNGFYRN